jgi:RNA polymerase sigma-70 factor (ECF subfamily)
VEPATLAERLSEAGDSQPHSTPTNIADPREEFESIWNAEWEEHLLKHALARVKRQANPEQYAIYHLREIEQRPVADVRQALGVSAAAIYMASHRVGALLKREIRRLREAEFGS